MHIKISKKKKHAENIYKLMCKINKVISFLFFFCSIETRELHYIWPSLIFVSVIKTSCVISESISITETWHFQMTNNKPMPFTHNVKKSPIIAWRATFSKRCNQVIEMSQKWARGSILNDILYGTTLNTHNTTCSLWK